jgi:hypothetical protein
VAKKIIQSTFHSINWGAPEIAANINPSPSMTPLKFHVPPQPSILPQMGQALPFVAINFEDLSNYQAPPKSLFSEEEAHWMRGKMVDYCKEKGQPLLIQVNQHPPHYTSLFCPYCYSEGKKGYIISTSNASTLANAPAALIQFHQPPRSPCPLSSTLPLQRGAKITPFILKRLAAYFRGSTESLGFLPAGPGDTFFCPQCNTVLHRDAVGALNLAKFNSAVWSAAKISAFIARIRRGDRPDRHTKKTLEEYSKLSGMLINADFIKKAFDDAEIAIPPAIDPPIELVADIRMRPKAGGASPAMHNFWNGIALALSPPEQQILKSAVLNFHAHFPPASPISLLYPTIDQELSNIFQSPATSQITHLANLWQQLKP